MTIPPTQAEIAELLKEGMEAIRTLRDHAYKSIDNNDHRRKISRASSKAYSVLARLTPTPTRASPEAEEMAGRLELPTTEVRGHGDHDIWLDIPASPLAKNAAALIRSQSAQIEALRADCARLEGALAAEIEACAQVAEDHRLGETLIRASMEADRNHVSWYGRVSRTIASAIRARAALVRMNNDRR